MAYRERTVHVPATVKKDLNSIKDIAREAGVSHSTVSRALRSSPLVNPETSERIRRIARENNFRLSAVGRSLATGRTHTIGVVVTTIADPFTSEVVSGVEDTANASGYSVILANSNSDPDREVRIVQSFEERRVDGILVMASRVGAAYLPLLADMNIPIVLINNQNPAAGFVHSIAIDNTLASQSAVRFLIQLGHKRIAYIGGRDGYQSDAERLNGFRQALAAANIAVDEKYIVQGDASPEGGQIAMQRLLALASPPTAVFCYNDMTALGALSAAQQRSLKVPEDLSIIGFDDLAISSYLNPPLTTVRQPKHQMGCAATQAILSLINGAKVENRRSVQCDLIVRESTAPPKS